jgi:hypothetical protein
MLQIGHGPKPVLFNLVLRARQTEEEEAAELADQVYRNKTFLNIPFIAGTGETYIEHFKVAMQKLKAAPDPKAKKAKTGEGNGGMKKLKAEDPKAKKAKP